MAINALAMAVENRQPDGPIIHSDHGTEFTSWAFTQRAVEASCSTASTPSLPRRLTP